MPETCPSLAQTAEDLPRSGEGRREGLMMKNSSSQSDGNIRLMETTHHFDSGFLILEICQQRLETSMTTNPWRRTRTKFLVDQYGNNDKDDIEARLVGAYDFFCTLECHGHGIVPLTRDSFFLLKLQCSVTGSKLSVDPRQCLLVYSVCDLGLRGSEYRKSLRVESCGESNALSWSTGTGMERIWVT